MNDSILTMNKAFLPLSFAGFIWACSPVSESETPNASHPLPYEYAAWLDTIELGEERLYTLRYTLVGGDTDTSVAYRIQLFAKSSTSVDTLVEYLAAGDSLHGEYVFVDMPVSLGPAAFSTSVQPFSPDGE